ALDVLLVNIDAFDQHMVGVNTLQDGAAALFIATGQYDDFVAFTDFFHDGSLQHFWSQRHDLHELLCTQFARYRSEDTGTDGFQFGVEQHGSVAAELDQRTVFATYAFSGPNHYCVINFALLDASAGCCIFDTNLDNVTDSGITAL